MMRCAASMALKPLLKTKVDELFLLWLSEPDTQNLLRSSLSQVIRGEPVTRPANQLSALVKPGNGGSGRQQAPKSPRIRPSSPPHLPTNVPSPRHRARHSLNVCTDGLLLTQLTITLCGIFERTFVNLCLTVLHVINLCVYVCMYGK